MRTGRCLRRIQYGLGFFGRVNLPAKKAEIVLNCIESGTTLAPSLARNNRALTPFFIF